MQKLVFIAFLENIGLVPNLKWLIEVLMGKSGIIIVKYFLSNIKLGLTEEILI